MESHAHVLYISVLGKALRLGQLVRVQQVNRGQVTLCGNLKFRLHVANTINAYHLQ